MHLPQVKALHTEAVAAADGVILYDPEWRLNDRIRREEVVIILAEVGTGVVSYSVQPQQSVDGVTYYNVGAALTAEGLTILTGIKCPYFKAELTAINPGVSGGSLTVTAA